MKSEQTAKNITRWTALVALFLIPLAPLIVADSYFFPFITGKAFFFRILVEIAVCAWAVLAFLDKEYRPRFSWVGVAVLAFVVWMFVADLFRRECREGLLEQFRKNGGLGSAHSSPRILRCRGRGVARGEKMARMVLHIAWRFRRRFRIRTLAARRRARDPSGLDAHRCDIRQFRLSRHLSSFQCLHCAVARVFPSKGIGQAEKRPWLKWSLIALAVVEAMLIFFTETRGTILGLVGAFALAALLAALTAGKRVRRSAAGALGVMLILVGGFYVARNSNFVQNNHVLQRIASISLADGQTRFTIWHMAFEGVVERPIVGWGQEGFNYVFNKYYDPSLYQQESWFDRAHNAFIDWLVAGGVPAFLLYLSLFGSALIAAVAKFGTLASRTDFAYRRACRLCAFTISLFLTISIPTSISSRCLRLSTRKSPGRSDFSNARPNSLPTRACSMRFPSRSLPRARSSGPSMFPACARRPNSSPRYRPSSADLAANIASLKILSRIPLLPRRKFANSSLVLRRPSRKVRRRRMPRNNRRFRLP